MSDLRPFLTPLGHSQVACLLDGEESTIATTYLGDTAHGTATGRGKVSRGMVSAWLNHGRKHTAKFCPECGLFVGRLHYADCSLKEAGATIKAR